MPQRRSGEPSAEQPMATDGTPRSGWQAGPLVHDPSRMCRGDKGAWLQRLQPVSFASPSAAPAAVVDGDGAALPSLRSARACSAGCCCRRRRLLVSLSALLIIVGCVNVELPFSAFYCCRAYMVAEPWGVLALAGAVTITHALCGATGLVLARQRRRSTAHAVCLSATYTATAVAASAAAAAYIGIMVSAVHEDHGEVTWRLLPGIYAYDALMLVAAAVGAAVSVAALAYGAHAAHAGVYRMRRRRQLRGGSGRQGVDYRRFSHSGSLGEASVRIAK